MASQTCALRFTGKVSITAPLLLLPVISATGENTILRKFFSGILIYLKATIGNSILYSLNLNPNLFSPTIWILACLFFLLLVPMSMSHG